MIQKLDEIREEVHALSTRPVDIAAIRSAFANLEQATQKNAAKLGFLQGLMRFVFCLLVVIASVIIVGDFVVKNRGWWQ